MGFVCGLGFNSLNLRVSDDNYRPLKSYDVWRAMLIRSLDHKFKKENPSYSDVTICSEWLDYCVFLEWYDSQYKEKDWQLDKDILVKGNQEYSPDKCCMVPRKINSFLIGRKRDRGSYPIGVSFREKYNNYQSGGGGVYLGVYSTHDEAFSVYKQWKESKVLMLADEFKTIIRDDVYAALCKYRVEITD
jgi:hypothetical protein